MDAVEAGIVPFEVMVLRGGKLIVEVFPALFRFLLGLGAVHPQQSGRLVRRKPELAPDRVEHLHLSGHLVEVRTRDKHLPKTVLSRHLG